MKWFGNHSAKGLPTPTLQGKTIDVGEHRLRVEEHLGDGGFAVIYRVKDVKTGQHYALKHVTMRSPEAKTALRDEAKMMKRVQGHPHVISLYCVAFGEEKDEEQDAFMLMDLCGESLYGYLHKRNFMLTETELLEIFASVCRAVQHLHSLKHPITHRDIKIENVLKHLNGNWVLCDFGSATTKTRKTFNPQTAQIDQQEINKNTTPAYRAPEMWDIMMGQPVDERADIWALGCMLYLLCYGSLPFTGESQLEVMAGKSSFPQTRDVACARAIAAMLQIDPERRPTIHSVMKMVDELRRALVPGGAPSVEKIQHQPPKQSQQQNQPKHSQHQPLKQPQPHQLEPRSQSATLRSEQILIPQAAVNSGSLSSRPSLTNSNSTREALQSSSKRTTTPDSDPRPRGQSLDGSAMPPPQRPPTASASAARPPNQTSKQNNNEDTEGRRNTPSIPKLPISPALAGSHRGQENTSILMDEVNSLKTAVGNLHEQNQLLWTRITTLENVVRSQQQLIHELQQKQQQQHQSQIPQPAVAPSPRREVPESPLPHIPVSIPPDEAPPRSPTPRAEDVTATPMVHPPPVQAASTMTPRKEQQRTPQEKTPVAKKTSQTTKTSSGRFAGTFWNSIAENTPQAQGREVSPALESIDSSVDSDNRHKRVVSDPPPLDSWHTSGKL